MAGRANHVDQMAAMTKVIEDTPHAVALRTHLRSIVESPAFKGSRRSQEFLQFIVDRALDGQFDDLKERGLGVELFGRSPSYDTGDDAIVRVTACDVRKRLAQFYAEFGSQCEFRLDLPPGSYIPEFRRVAAGLVPCPAKAVDTLVEPSLPEREVLVEVATPVPVEKTLHRGRRWLWMTVALVVCVACVATAFWLGNSWRTMETAAASNHVLPWSVLVHPNRQIHVIFCDPEIVTVQRLLNYSVSLSDYANQRYWPEDIKPDARRILQAVSFRGASVAAVDASIALKIDSLITPSAKRPMQVHTARNVRLGDFKTEDSFIVMGSPRSNPWVELFQDQLDFRFEFDPVRRAEFLRNRRPSNGEAPMYVPTAAGWGTGLGYAIVALVNNPDQNGHVLLLAGSTAEATEAAGKLAATPDVLGKILKDHGIDPKGAVRNFEVLLRVSTLAGMPNTSDVVACHVLNGR